MNPDPKDVNVFVNETEFMSSLSLSRRIAVAHRFESGLNGTPIDLDKAFDIFKETGEKGSAEGLYNTGRCYGAGIGTSVDLIKMMECYKAAAAQKPFVKIPYSPYLFENLGVAAAYNGIGNSYRDGRGVDVDYKIAFEHYLRAGELEAAEAQNNLGFFLYKGLGVAKNLVFARDWYKKAAEQGLAEAEFNYAGMLQKGEGGTVDEKKALEYYSRAAKQGLSSALVGLKMLKASLGIKNSLGRENLPDMLKNDTEALVFTGLNYSHGDFGVEKDLNKAYECFKEAVNKGSVDGAFCLSEILFEEMKKNEEGFKYCLEAAEGGSLQAQYKLANLYAYGHGCARDEEKARRMAKRAHRNMDEKQNNKSGVTKQEEDKEDLRVGAWKNESEVESMIELGKSLCDFEKRNGFGSDGLRLKEREVRYLNSRVDSRLFKSQKETDLFEKVISSEPRVLRPCSGRPMSFEWLPKIAQAAEKGSVTAYRMLVGLEMSLKALDCIEANECDEAMSLIRQSFNHCDKNCFFDLKKAEHALERCENPESVDAMFVKALKFQNDIKGAILFTKRCVKLHPREAIFHFYLSSLYGFDSQYSNSLREINRALELDSSNPRWFYTKATAIRLAIDEEADLNMAKSAIEWYQKYLDSNPPDDRKVSESFYSMASLCISSKLIDKMKFYFYKGKQSEKTRMPCFEPVEDTWPPKMYVSGLLMLVYKNCGQCQKPSPRFKCGCLEESYCGKKCQSTHWRIHKQICSKQPAK